MKGKRATETRNSVISKTPRKAGRLGDAFSAPNQRIRGTTVWLGRTQWNATPRPLLDPYLLSRSIHVTNTSLGSHDLQNLCQTKTTRVT